MLPVFNASKVAAQMTYFEILPTHEHVYDRERFLLFFERLADVSNYWYRFVLVTGNGRGTIYMGCPPNEGAVQSFLSALHTSCPEVEPLPVDGIPTSDWPSDVAVELCPSSDILPLRSDAPETVFDTAARALGLGRVGSVQGVLEVCFDPLSRRKERALHDKANREIGRLLGLEPRPNLLVQIERQLGPQALSLSPGKRPVSRAVPPRPGPVSPVNRDVAYAIRERFASGSRFFRALVRCSVAGSAGAADVLNNLASSLSRGMSWRNQLVPCTRHGAAERLRRGVLGPWDGGVFSSRELAQLVTIPSADSATGRHIKSVGSRVAAPPPEMLDFGDFGVEGNG